MSEGQMIVKTNISYYHLKILFLIKRAGDINNYSNYSNYMYLQQCEKLYLHFFNHNINWK